MVQICCVLCQKPIEDRKDLLVVKSHKVPYRSIAPNFFSPYHIICYFEEREKMSQKMNMIFSRGAHENFLLNPIFSINGWLNMYIILSFVFLISVLVVGYPFDKLEAKDQIYLLGFFLIFVIPGFALKAYSYMKYERYIP